MAEQPTFIGLEALKQICVKYQPQIIMAQHISARTCSHE